MPSHPRLRVDGFSRLRRSRGLADIASRVICTRGGVRWRPRGHRSSRPDGGPTPEPAKLWTTSTSPGGPSSPKAATPPAHSATGCSAFTRSGPGRSRRRSPHMGRSPGPAAPATRPVLPGASLSMAARRDHRHRGRARFQQRHDHPGHARPPGTFTISPTRNDALMVVAAFVHPSSGTVGELVRCRTGSPNGSHRR